MFRFPLFYLSSSTSFAQASYAKGENVSYFILNLS